MNRKRESPYSDKCCSHSLGYLHTCAGRLLAGSVPAPARPACGEEPQMNPGVHRHPRSKPEGRKQLGQVSKGQQEPSPAPRSGQSLWKNIPERQATTSLGSPSNTQIPKPESPDSASQWHPWGLLVTKGVTAEPPSPTPVPRNEPFLGHGHHPHSIRNTPAPCCAQHPPAEKLHQGEWKARPPQGLCACPHRYAP